MQMWIKLIILLFSIDFKTTLFFKLVLSQCMCVPNKQLPCKMIVRFIGTGVDERQGKKNKSPNIIFSKGK